MPDPDSIIRPIQTSLRVLVVTTVILYLVIGGVVVWTFTNSQNNNDALCSLRADVETRLAASEEFLRDNPKGIPGIPAATLRQGQQGQRSTIRSLSDLSC